MCLSGCAEDPSGRAQKAHAQAYEKNNASAAPLTPGKTAIADPVSKSPAKHTAPGADAGGSPPKKKAKV
jgi:hypothetical protein